MNYLQSIAQLQNQYYVMRHGQSKANIQGIIIGDPANGLLDEYALTPNGKEQARIAAERSSLGKDTIIYSSDFSRARETAEIVCQTIGAAPVTYTPALRERNFGNWEKQDHAHYHDVWAIDEADAEHIEHGVESVNLVLDRATNLILIIESEYRDKNILLVSHGDCLQILQTGFQKVAGSKHRSLRHLETAEIRALYLQP